MATIEDFQKLAIELSRESIALGGFPVGAIVVKGSEIIGKGLSNGKNNKDATNHAEIEAIRNASKELNSRDLFGCELYSSMEPCLMCLAAAYWAKIDKIFFAVGKDNLSKEHFEGINSLQAVNSKFNKPLEIIHVKDLEAGALFVVREWEQCRRENKV